MPKSKLKKIKKTFEGFKLSPDQVQAIETIMGEGRCFFLTGGAGTGKSFVIRYLKEHYDDCEVCAMTGVAAQLLDSRTAHSFLGIIPVDEWLRKKRTAEGEANPSYYLKQPKISEKTGKLQKDWPSINVGKARMVIIDEISMASAEFVVRIAERFKKACGDMKDYWPKLVIVGDLLQLPPTEGERFFMNAGMDRFKVIQLRQQHRQAAAEDKDFLTTLNEIRVGVLSDSGKSLLQKRLVDGLPKDCTHLHAKNEHVDETNQRRLEELEGDPIQIDWEYEFEDFINRDNEDDEEKIRVALHYARNKESPKVIEILTLKEGARIMILNNDSNGRWVNGSTGEVLSIGDDFITVKLDRKDEIVEVGRIEEDLLWGWKKIGVIRQFPLKLAYACTIHKAQGMTLDRIGVNLSDHFDCGMTYVALSRCRYFNGLYLCGRFPDEIYVDNDALNFLDQRK